jgi:hypothetical protein
MGADSREMRKSPLSTRISVSTPGLRAAPHVETAYEVRTGVGLERLGEAGRCPRRGQIRAMLNRLGRNLVAG